MKNNYFLLRHGESFSNVRNIVSCFPEKLVFPLTEKGKKQIKKASKELKDIDLFFSSDILRTVQTSEIIERKLEISPKYDKRLREYNVGELNGKSIEKLRNFFNSEEERFIKNPPGGETYLEISKRINDFLKELEENYSDKNILVVSHQLTLTFLESVIRGIKKEEILKKYPSEKRIKKGEIRKF